MLADGNRRQREREREREAECQRGASIRLPQVVEVGLLRREGAERRQRVRIDRSSGGRTADSVAAESHKRGERLCASRCAECLLSLRRNVCFVDAMFGVLGGQRSAKPAAAQRSAGQRARCRCCIESVGCRLCSPVSSLWRCGEYFNASKPERHVTGDCVEVLRRGHALSTGEVLHISWFVQLDGTNKTVLGTTVCFDSGWVMHGWRKVLPQTTP